MTKAVELTTILISKEAGRMPAVDAGLGVSFVSHLDSRLLVVCILAIIVRKDLFLWDLN